jgi:hypothetical protein
MYIYYENHHIIPKCLNGSDDKNNKVLLTAKEHYICHKLLIRIYPRNYKISCAFFRMTFDKKGNKNISAKDYSYAKELFSMIPIPEEIKNKMKGRKCSKETRQKMSKSKKFLSRSEEHKKHLKESHKNNGNNQLGKKRDKYAKHKENKICKYCNKYVSNNMFARWHGEKCKNKH